jgi:hypothetical protein
LELESSSDSVGEAEEAFSLVETLTADRTFLCTDVSSNIVVLKRLNDDCLHRRQLHPSIRERLAKVRELPHPRLATLRGVERWQGNACLVWTWLDGETWEELVAKPLEDVGSLASALVEAVDALHELNVTVRANGQVWLTDLSPYLYSDPAADIAAVIRMLDEVLPSLPPAAAERLARLLDETAAGRFGLRQLSQALRELQTEDNGDVAMETANGGSYRMRSLVSAGLVLLMGAGLWAATRWYYSKKLAPVVTPFPSLKVEQR